MNIFKFQPLLKSTLWGGERIIPFKHLNDNMENVGESWEISGVKDNETIVSEGQYKGKKLNDLVAELKEKLVGKECYKRYGDEFPLLIKFIDARQDLSIQVHPTDEIAKKQGRERGKTEMWYLMDSAPEAKLYSGLKKKITPEEYKKMVEDDTICDALAQYAVKEGDVFFLPAGRIHAIGAGCFLAEIQQTSDVTWRIYDFKRKDKNGNYRELHTQQASEAIDYAVYDNYRTEYTPVQNQRQEVVKCQYFTTSIFDLTSDGGEKYLDYTNHDGFVILIGVKGEGTLTNANGESTSLNTGETILIPATETKFKVTGNVRFLEVYG
ncbi:MAG: class I mannose-6-phosphate isomerase [Prevotella sp.]|nr:class I mannose-6-phosphate isomerase [Prevotella sp.]